MRQVHVVASDCRKRRLLLHGLMCSAKHRDENSVICISVVLCKQLIAFLTFQLSVFFNFVKENNT